MSEHGCKIGKVVMKGNLRLLPTSQHSISEFDLGWGSVTFRLYDGDKITGETMIYMTEALKNRIIHGDEL